MGFLKGQLVRYGRVRTRGDEKFTARHGTLFMVSNDMPTALGQVRTRSLMTGEPVNFDPDVIEVAPDGEVSP